MKKVYFEEVSGVRVVKLSVPAKSAVPVTLRTLFAVPVPRKMFRLPPLLIVRSPTVRVPAAEPLPGVRLAPLATVTAAAVDPVPPRVPEFTLSVPAPLFAPLSRSVPPLRVVAPE